MRIVERKEPRLDLGDGEAGNGTGKFRGEENPLPFRLRRAAGRRVRKLHHRQPVAKLERRLETLREPRRHVGPHDNAVDHDLDVVLELLV